MERTGATRVCRGAEVRPQRGMRSKDEGEELAVIGKSEVLLLNPVDKLACNCIWTCYFPFIEYFQSTCHVLCTLLMTSFCN